MEALKYLSIAELVDQATAQGARISQIVLRDQAEQMDTEPQVLFRKMRENYHVLQESIQKGADPDIKSTSGLTGGDAWKLYSVYEKKKSLTGSFMAGAMWRALAVSELNAAMGRIVAAPTAGSCGILPAAIVTMQEEYSLDEYDCIMTLFTASAVGMVIGNNASLAGASGGCQAECGVAAAMAAAGAVEMKGGTPAQALDAAAFALKNVMGLVCDPVAGLVQVPCALRNASQAVNALLSADLALGGMKSLIPLDEVVEAMYNVGHMLPTQLRETALGGIAATPTGVSVRVNMHK